MRRATKKQIARWVHEGERFDSDFFHPWDSTTHELSFMDERMATRHLNGKGRRLVIMEPPSFWGLRQVQRKLHRVLVKLNAQVIYMQPRQYNDAGIDVSSIEIIDTGRLNRNKTKGMDVLFTADVTRAWSSRVMRRGLFISGFDPNEKVSGYFLCEVPQGDNPPRTLAEAYEALKPDVVKQAEAYGRTVKRQGDLFFIPLPEFSPTADDEAEKVYKDQAIFGTNHFAESITWRGQYPNHATGYVRGTIKHRPARRRPDHAPVRLGETWHLVVRNLVPIEAREERKKERNWI